MVGVQIDRSHTQEVAAAVGPSLGDGVAHAAVGQPASAAHVHPALPGQVELARGGQSRPQPPALIGCLLERELLRRGGIKDLACEGHITPGEAFTPIPPCLCPQEVHGFSDVYPPPPRGPTLSPSLSVTPQSPFLSGLLGRMASIS